MHSINKALLILLALFVPIILPAEEPSVVEEAETLEPGIWTLDLGMIYRDNPVDYGVEDRQYSIGAPAAKFSFGIGDYVEIQLKGAFIVWMQDQDGTRTTNSGDWELATKVWYLTEKGKRPSASFYYSVKLPNGDDTRGGSTDETDFYGHLLFDKTLHPNLISHLSLGLGILGNPFANKTQDDVFTFGLSFDYRTTPHDWLTIDFGGESGPKIRDDPHGLMLSWSHIARIWTFYGSSGLGLGSDEENFRLILGCRRAFNLKLKGTRKRSGRGHRNRHPH